jgi:hypothetical protein
MEIVFMKIRIKDTDWYEMVHLGFGVVLDGKKS